MSADFRRSSVAAVALGALAALPYMAGLDYAFVYDDHAVIVENGFLDDENAAREVFTLQTLLDAKVIDGQRPAVLATYLAERRAWGVWSPGYRITNVFLHAFNTLLVFWGLRRLMRSREPSASRHGLSGEGCEFSAWMAALLFAWHPLAVEAVQVPAFREDLLYLCGGLIFMHVGLGAKLSLGRVVIGIMAYGAALLSKEAAVVFPVLLIMAWMLLPFCRPARGHAAWLLIAALLMTIAFAGMVVFRGELQSLGDTWNGRSLRGSERLWTPPWLALRMLGKMILPVSLSADYVITPVASPFDPRFMYGLLVLAAGVLLLMRLHGRMPDVAVGVAWIMVLFIPASNLLPLFNPVADRYAYGVLPGFVLLVAWALGAAGKTGRALLVLLAVTCLGMTMNRLPNWKDDRSLWESVLRAEPRSARAHTWIGLLEKEKGEHASAMKYFEEAERLNPHDVSSSINRAVMLGEQGNLQEAERILREILSRHPDNRQAQANLELCLRLQGR